MKSPISCLLMGLMLLSLVSCTSGNKESTQADGPQIRFETTTHDFGKISIGQKVSWSFTFTNTGSAALKIQRIETSCGCTVPEASKKVIAPGESGKIRVEFDTAGFFGKQEKAIQVFTNAPGKVSHLSIKAYVN